MILFLDTSALAKLYVNQPGRHQVLQAMQNARLLAASELTLVESHSALARLARDGRAATGVSTDRKEKPAAATFICQL